MRFPSAALLASGLLTASASARFVMYADEWHPTRPTNPADRAGIDHVVLAFAMANATALFQPKVPISTIRSEYPNAKIMIAVGGWGDDIGFAAASKSDATIAKFADDVATMLTNTGADGVDIDWEYPGGNGADYKQVPNSAKVNQIEAYPKALAAIRAAIGDKLLSIAVPGKKGDMIGFTSETGPKIWDSVDYINVMSYDLANRRDNVTKHHSSVAGSEEAIKNYLDISAPPEKINLGFAYYAKYFTTQGDCGSSPLGCPIVPAEDPVTGKDLLTSGAWTFESAHMKPVDSSALPISYDGTCGPDKGTKCGSGCCSQYGNCGTSPEHCSGACWHAFGTGCTDADVAGSWQVAAKNGMTDQNEGGQYYFDSKNRLFWTWDTPELITKKFQNIVQKYKLGGVMAWSLGEDSYDWSHIRQMASELKKRSTGGDTPRPGYSQPMQAASSAVETYASSALSRPRPTQSSPYDVVFVDGTEQGPTGEPSMEPGSPSDFTVDYNGGRPVESAPNSEAYGTPTASYPQPESGPGTPTASAYAEPYESPTGPYVAPGGQYTAPTEPSLYASSSPTPEDISSAPVNPYVAPEAPSAAPYDAPAALSVPYIAPEDPPSRPTAAPAESYMATETPVTTPAASEASIYIDPIFPSAPASTPTRLVQPFPSDFVPDPGYVNPNWHPEAAPVANIDVPAAAPTTPIRVSAQDQGDATEDAATWAQPVQQNRVKVKACRAKRHRNVKRGGN